MSVRADTRHDAAPADRFSSEAQHQSSHSHLPQDIPPLYVAVSGTLCGQ